MAKRRQVVEICCDRCKRIEYLDPGEYSDGPDFHLQYGRGPGDVTTYEDLCSSCFKAVANYVKQIRMEAKKKDDPPEVEPSLSETEVSTTPEQQAEVAS